MTESWWEWQSAEEQRQRQADALRQQYAASQSRRPLVSFLDTQGKVTPRSLVSGVFDVFNLGTETIGKPLLGVLTEALTPGQQITGVDPNAPWWEQVKQFYEGAKRAEEARPELFGFDIPRNVPLIGGTHVGEKFITENILFDPLNWLGWGGTSLLKGAMPLLDAAGVAEDVAQGAKLVDLIADTRRALSLAEDATEAAQLGRKLELLQRAEQMIRVGQAGHAIDVATTPLAWPGVAAGAAARAGKPGLALAAKGVQAAAYAASAPALAAAAPWMLVEPIVRKAGGALVEGLQGVGGRAAAKAAEEGGFGQLVRQDAGELELPGGIKAAPEPPAQPAGEIPAPPPRAQAPGDIDQILDELGHPSAAEAVALSDQVRADLGLPEGTQVLHGGYMHETQYAVARADGQVVTGWRNTPEEAAAEYASRPQAARIQDTARPVPVAPPALPPAEVPRAEEVVTAPEQLRAQAAPPAPPAPPAEPPAPPRTPVEPEYPRETGEEQLTRWRDALSRPPTDVRGWVAQAVDWIQRAAIDKTHPLRRLEAMTGLPVHKLAQVVPGAQAWGERIIEREFRPVFDSVGEDIERLQEYRSLLHAQEVIAAKPDYRLPGGVTDPGAALEALRAEIGGERMARLQEADRRLTELNVEYVLQPMLDEGLISQDVFDLLKSKYPHYVPFQRQDYAWHDRLTTGAGRKVASVEEQIVKSLTEHGSKKRLDEPLARLVMQTIRTQTLIARNRAARTLAEALQQAFPDEVKPGKKVIGFTEDGTPITREPRVTTTRGTLHWYDGGERKVLDVPKVWEEVAKGLDYETSGALGRILGAMARPFRIAVVQSNPLFLPANRIRDAISAYMMYGLNPFGRDAIAGLLSVIGKDETFDEALKSGALMSGITEMARDVQSLKEVRRFGSIRVESPMDALLLLPRLVMRANEILEQSTRVAVFKKLRAQGLDTLESAVAGRTCTVDFAQSGYLTKVLNQGIPFLTAGIGGMANTVRLLKETPRAGMARLAPLVAASALFWVWNQHFQTAQDIPEYEYANNWIIQIGEGEKKPDPKYPGQPGKRFPIYVKIPKGPMGAALMAPVEALLHIAWNQGDKSVVEHFLSAGSAIARSFSPIEPTVSGVLPPVVGTALELQIGRNLYTGREIVPEGELGRPPEEQYGPDTSSVAIALGQASKVSPRLIEFALRDYFGGTAQTGLWMTDVALRALGYDPEAPGGARRADLTVPEQIAATPAGRFIGVRANEAERQAYAKLDKAVADQRSQLYRNPEVRRFGMGINAPGDTITVDGVPQAISPQQRVEIVERSTPLVSAALNELVQRDYYQAADELTKRRLLDRVRQTIQENAREAVVLGGEQWNKEKALLFIQALGEKLEYDAIPAYAGMTPAQAEKASQAQSQMAALKANNPTVAPQRIEAVYRWTDPEGYSLAQRLRSNPARRAFLAAHPLIRVFFGTELSPEAQQVQAMLGQAYPQQQAYAYG